MKTTRGLGGGVAPVLTAISRLTWNRHSVSRRRRRVTRSLSCLLSSCSPSRCPASLCPCIQLCPPQSQSSSAILTMTPSRTALPVHGVGSNKHLLGFFRYTNIHLPDSSCSCKRIGKNTGKRNS
uniref:Uncharacterized protein n=1 Tax=Serinus canaria TaxID=9135 RepID=A0A8C9N0D5_SERCA